VVAAFVFVFIPTIGEFVTPLLVGGTSGYMYGNAIQDSFTRGIDWQFGSVLAMFLLLVVAGLMMLFGRFVQVRSVAG
jgi:spermidine/putrescine transport system permease protein